jgi:hypothetical protein
MELAPYHIVCPASFFMPLKSQDFKTNVQVALVPVQRVYTACLFVIYTAGRIRKDVAHGVLKKLKQQFLRNGRALSFGGLLSVRLFSFFLPPVFLLRLWKAW